MSEENVNKSMGIFDQRNQVVKGNQTNNFYTGEQEYDVSGLGNPYLGLRAFVYTDHPIYGGREKEINIAVQQMSRNSNQAALFFITGGSGSGKSSFAQAGLIPALERCFKQKCVFEVFRPASEPINQFVEALRNLGIHFDSDHDASNDPTRFFESCSSTSDNVVHILLVDQFEELFSVTLPKRREQFIRLLAKVPPFTKLKLQILATMRSDYLPDLFEYQDVYELTKVSGIDLRVMSSEQLSDAIYKPLIVQHPGSGKKFQKALINRLVEDAHEDATLLPLLQVTLEDLWRSGFLTIDYYDDLSQSISKRADEVFDYRQDPSGSYIPRTKEEQKSLMEIFLDLVVVSPEKEISRDIRRRRNLDELIRGDESKRVLIDELSTRRLLSTSSLWAEESREYCETVDIIHESLISNWERLNKAIQQQREKLQRRARFESSLNQWKDQNRDESYLLNGLRLAEAEELAKSVDVSLQNREAKEFLARSIQKQQQWRRIRVSISVVAVCVLIGFLIFSLDSQKKRSTALSELNAKGTEIASANDRATQIEKASKLEAKRAYFNMVASYAKDVVNSKEDPTGNLPLLLSSYAITGLMKEVGVVSGEADAALRNAIHEAQPRQIVIQQKASVNSIAWSPDGKYIAASDNNLIRIWDPKTGAELFHFTGHVDPIRALAWSPDSKYIVSGSGYIPPSFYPSDALTSDLTVRIWSIDSKMEIKHFDGFEQPIVAVDWDPSGKYVAAASGDSVRIWEVESSIEQQPLLGHLNTVNTVKWSPNGQYIATGSGADEISSNHDTDRSVRIWDASSHTEILEFMGHTANVNSISWSPDSKYVASASGDIGGDGIETRLGTDFSIRIWGIEEQMEIKRIDGHEAEIHSIAWSPNGQYIISAAGSATGFADRMSSVDHTARLWDYATGQEVIRLNVHDGPILSVAWSPDSSMVAIGSGVELFLGNTNADLGEAFSLRIWGVQQRYEPMEMRDIQGNNWFWLYLSRVTWSRDNNFVAVVNNTRLGYQQQVWNIETGQEIALQENQYGRTLDEFYWSHLPIEQQQAMLVFDAPNSSELSGVSPDTASMQRLAIGDKFAWSPSGDYIATIEDSKLAIWDSHTNNIVKTIEHFHGNVISMAWSMESRLLAVALENGVIQIWQVDSGEKVQELSGPTNNLGIMSWSAAGKYLLVASLADNKQLEMGSPMFTSPALWDVSSGKLIHQFDNDVMLFESPWSSTYQLLFLRRDSNNLSIWDVQTDQEIKVLNGHTAPILDAKWNPNPNFYQIVSGSSDNTARLWDVKSGAQLRVWEHPGAVGLIAWSSDGKHIATGCADNNVRVWLTQIDDVLVLAQTFITRNPPRFSKEEVARYDLK